MTTDAPAPNHVTAEVDQAMPRRTKDGVRFLVTFSFPFKSNKGVALALMEQIGNPLDVDFTMMQPSLESVKAATAKTNGATITGPQQDIRYAEHKTTVDGAEAIVMLPVTEGGRRNRIAPHPYKDDPENASKCLWCQHGANYQAHDEARIAAATLVELGKVKSNGHKPTPDELAAQGEEMHQRFVEAYKTPHAFETRTQDDCCGACGHPAVDAIHVPAVEVDSIPEHLQNDNGATGNRAADALIEGAKETEAVPSA